MKIEDIKVGSVVQLNSGSLKMTALRVADPGCYDFAFFYDEKHGPTEPLILENIPVECVYLVEDKGMALED